jgi:hypothetical protein
MGTKVHINYKCQFGACQCLIIYQFVCRYNGTSNERDWK